MGTTSATALAGQQSSSSRGIQQSQGGREIIRSFPGQNMNKFVPAKQPKMVLQDGTVVDRSQLARYGNLEGQMDFSDDSDSEEDKESSESSSSSSSDDDKSSDDNEESQVSSTEKNAEEIELNSGDDISDNDATTFETVSNTILCQFDTIKRRHQQKWSIKLRDGVMHIDGKDYTFSRCTGEADW